MKTFVMAWEEYLSTGNARLDENNAVLCSGEAKIEAESDKAAKKIWKRMFPRTIVLCCWQENKLDKG